MRYISPSEMGVASFAVAAILCPSAAFAAVTATVDHPTYNNPATVLMTTTGTPQLNVYLAQGSFPIASTNATVANVTAQDMHTYGWNNGSFDGMTDGSYQFVAVDTTSCAALSYAACIAGNTGVHIAEADFTISTPAPSIATSTPDQSHDDVFYLWVVFFSSMTFVVWSFKKR